MDGIAESNTNGTNAADSQIVNTRSMRSSRKRKQSEDREEQHDQPKPQLQTDDAVVSGDVVVEDTANAGATRTMLPTTMPQQGERRDTGGVAGGDGNGDVFAQSLPTGAYATATPAVSAAAPIATSFDGEPPSKRRTPAFDPRMAANPNINPELMGPAGGVAGGTMTEADVAAAALSGQAPAWWSDNDRRAAGVPMYSGSRSLATSGGDMQGYPSAQGMDDRVGGGNSGDNRPFNVYPGSNGNNSVAATYAVAYPNEDTYRSTSRTRNSPRDTEASHARRPVDDRDSSRSPRSHGSSQPPNSAFMNLPPETRESLGGGSQPYSRSPELRVSHKLAERKRRREMKDLFDELKDQLPADRGMKASKWEILSKAVDFINHIKRQNVDMGREIEGLRREIDGMKAGAYAAAAAAGGAYSAPPPSASYAPAGSSSSPSYGAGLSTGYPSTTSYTAGSVHANLPQSNTRGGTGA